MKNILEKYRSYGEMFLSICGGAMGYMVPVLENGKKVERTLFRQASAVGHKRPFSWAGFDMETGMLLYYKHCSAEDFADTKTFRPDSEIKSEYVSPRTAAQQIEYERQLWSEYEQIREFALETEVNEQQKAQAAAFGKQWEKTVLKDLVPYYKALAPEFFEWIVQMSDQRNK